MPSAIVDVDGVTEAVSFYLEGRVKTGPMKDREGSLVRELQSRIVRDTSFSAFPEPGLFDPRIWDALEGFLHHAKERAKDDRELLARVTVLIDAIRDNRRRRNLRKRKGRERQLRANEKKVGSIAQLMYDC